MSKESGVRKRILDTAAHLFQGQGYKATGINQVIDEAKIAKRSLYTHFESKTELLNVYLNNFEDNWYATIAPHLASIGNPKERLLAVFDFRILYQKNYNTTQALSIIEAEMEATPERDEILDFIRNSSRGIMKGYSGNY